MALQCCGESAALCDALTAELNDWIAYILKERVRGTAQHCCCGAV